MLIKQLTPMLLFLFFSLRFLLPLSSLVRLKEQPRVPLSSPRIYSTTSSYWRDSALFQQLREAENKKGKKKRFLEEHWFWKLKPHKQWWHLAPEPISTGILLSPGAARLCHERIILLCSTSQFRCKRASAQSPSLNCPTLTALPSFAFHHLCHLCFQAHKKTSILNTTFINFFSSEVCLATNLQQRYFQWNNFNYV